jgi:hypothetical protein
MTAISISFTFGFRQLPAATTAWHLCTVIIPRRTITGRLVRGQVWRRHNGRHWLYKKFNWGRRELGHQTPRASRCDGVER